MPTQPHTSAAKYVNVVMERPDFLPIETKNRTDTINNTATRPNTIPQPIKNGSDENKSGGSKLSKNS